MDKRFSFPKEKMKILMLEAIHPVSRSTFESAGYKTEIMSAALPESELLKIIPNVHVLGIRSKTQISANVFKAAKNLLTVGCFCIGTNQVDLEAAAGAG